MISTQRDQYRQLCLRRIVAFNAFSMILSRTQVKINTICGISLNRFIAVIIKSLKSVRVCVSDNGDFGPARRAIP